MNAFVRRGLVYAAALAAVVACGSTKHSEGGVVVSMSIDSTLKVSELSALVVEVDPGGDAGVPYSKQTFAIPSRLDSFPTTLAIKSNGQPTASAILHVSLWSRSTPATSLDERAYQLVDIPVDSVTNFDIVFSRQCTPGLTACGSTSTCCPRPSGVGGCSTDVVDGAQPHVSCLNAADSGAPEAEAGVADGSTVDADGGAPGDATVDEMEAALDGGSDAPTGTCNPACVEGQTHCVGGKCVPVPPSCVGGGLGAGLNCGPEGFGTLDCCATLDTPLASGGSFYLHSDPGSPSTTFPATVSQFSLDTFEVTVGRFRKFVAAAAGQDGGTPWVPPAGGGKHAHLAGGLGLNAGGSTPTVYEPGWQSSWNSSLPATTADWNTRLDYCVHDAGFYADPWTPDVGANEKLPMTCIDWYTAYAFCIWDGGFLPSATEWEFAAVGGSNQRTFAWGEQLPGVDWNYAVYQCYYGSPQNNYGSGALCLGLANLAPVGSAPAGQGLFGQFDLAGNAYEFVLDFYSGSYANPCDDCADVRTGGERILRGGGFDSNQNQLASGFQTHSQPALAHGDVGVRCARAPY